MASMEQTIARLEAVCARLETVALKAGGAAADPEVPPEGYLKMKEVFDNQGKAFIDLWAGLGSKKKKYAEYCEPPVPIGATMTKAMDCVLSILCLTNKCKTPSQEQLAEAMQPVFEACEKAGKIAFTRNASWRKFDDHHKAFEQLMEGFKFVMCKPPNLPAAFWFSQGDAMYATMTGKCWAKKKEKEKDYMRSWMNAGKAFYEAVNEVIVEHYKVGVEFCGKEDFALGDLPAAPAVADEKAPADPAKVEEEVEAADEPVKEAPKKAEEPKKPGLSFAAELSKGLAVTSGLKKVKKEQKNKYKKEKISGKVGGGASKARIKKKKDPKRVKRGNMWQFLDYQNQEDVVLEGEDYEMKHGLYFADCINSIFTLNSKVKTVSLDSCKKTSFVINCDLVSEISMVNCQGCKIQMNGKVGSYSFDKSGNCVIYINKEGWQGMEPKPQIVWSNCAAVTLSFCGLMLNGKECDENTWEEFPLPEQFIFGGPKANSGVEFNQLEHSD